MDRLTNYLVVASCSIVIIFILLIASFGLYNTFNAPSPLPAVGPKPTQISTTATQLPATQNRLSKKHSTANKSRSTKQTEIYRKLQQTCNKWTKWYNSDRTEISRVNMNIACKDAKKYAQNALGVNTGAANHVAKTATIRRASNARPATSKRTSPNRLSQYCDNWRAKLTNIQSQLRAGYKEPKGNRLRKQRREVSELIKDNC